MAELKTKIDEILSERKSRIGMISSRNDLIDSLYPNLQKIQKTISELGVEGADEKARIIESFLTNLDQAREKLRLLKKRYAKDTINIGVSGFTHAGKSTLLQAISGLSDNEIPKADEDDEDSLHATTAICSQIFNSPEKYAEVFYKTDKEFVEFVNAHLEMAGLNTISDKGEFPKVQIPENNDTEEEKNTIKDRLRLLQEGFPFYKDKIGNGYEKISGNNLNRLDSYVSYSKKDKMTRFFPAVKEVKIYCPFPALGNPDVKLCLVDLPGFGEFNKVDEIQISNLKEIVDHIIFIYKTDDSLGIDKKHFRESYFAIKGIHPAQSNNPEFLLNFLSFLINERRIGNWQNLVKQTFNTIRSTYGNYKYYNFPALLDNQPNKADAEKNLNDILSRLSQTLPQMDECLLKSLGESLNVSEIIFLLKDLAKWVSQYSYQNDIPSDLSGKGVNFRRNLYNKIEKQLLQKYVSDKETIDAEFVKKLNEITANIKKEFSETMLYSQINKDYPADWRAYVESISGADGIKSIFSRELRRVWVEIMSRYAELDVDFHRQISKLKGEILSIFDEMTKGGIVPKLENGDYDLKSLVEEKLAVLKSDNAIYKAFKDLDTLNQDFRQNLYPFVFKTGLDRLMYEKGDRNGVQRLNDDMPLTVDNFKQQLDSIFTEMVHQISTNIKQFFILSHFLIGALHTFLEKISNVKTDTNNDFVHFCSVYRRVIYPDEYGSEADSIKAEELKTLISQTQDIISKF